MLYTIAVVLVLLWLIGLLGGPSFGINLGWLLHVLLVLAVIVVLLQFISGRRAL